MEQSNHSIFPSEKFNFIPVLEKVCTQDDIVFGIVVVKQ